MNNRNNRNNTMNQTRFEVHVGLHVTNESQYQMYRDGMTPILTQMGGDFRYDMRVNELIKGDAPDPFNRVFVISFPDEPTKDAFFANEQYRAVRTLHFDPSVKSATIIAQYTCTLL